MSCLTKIQIKKKLLHLNNYGRLFPQLNQQISFKKVSTVYSYSVRQTNAKQIPRFSAAKRQKSFIKSIGSKIWNNIA